MRRARLMAVATAMLATAVPAAAEEPPTTYTRVLEELVATFGFVPATALVDGVEVPTEDALALLRENAAPLPPDENLYLPPDDAWVAVRQGANPCLVAALVSATRVGVGEPQPAFAEERQALGPGGTLACGVGFPYGTGVGGAEVAPGASASFAAANMAGRVGFVDVKFRFFEVYYHIEQMFCGVGAWAPGPSGNLDACVVTVQH